MCPRGENTQQGENGTGNRDWRQGGIQKREGKKAEEDGGKKEREKVIGMINMVGKEVEKLIKG